MLFKVSVIKKFTMFTGKHLCWSFFFNKVEGLRLAKPYRSGDPEYDREKDHQVSSSKRGTVYHQLVSG